MKTVSIYLGELELEITGFYIPCDPMVHTYSNGDPGYPGAPSEFEIEKIKFKGTEIIDLIQELDGLLPAKLSTNLWTQIEEKVIEQIEN